MVTKSNSKDMFKTNFRRVLGLVLSIFVAGSLAVSCYDDSELRASIENLQTQLGQLQTLVSSLQNDDAVTGVTQNSDGSYTITFKKSGAVTIRNGKDGKNGENGENGENGKDGSIVTVVKGEDTYTFTFSDGTTVVLPRYSEVRVLTFEDTDYKGSLETTSYWTNLIDTPEYGGELLYGKDRYIWYDENNTTLYSFSLAQDFEAFTYGFSSGGIAVSNYGTGDFNGVGYDRQLEVYVPGAEKLIRKSAGNGGSDNFAVAYVTGFNPAAISMKDGVARTILSASVTNVAYTLNSLVNGDDYAAKMASNGFYRVTATGYVGEEAVGTASKYLASGTIFNVEWSEWDLSKLGAVDKVVFTIDGSSELYGDWGLNTPSYFAIDDIAVRVYPD